MLEWVPKCEMWVMGNHNLPYMGQDTNATIINYHANLKATLRMAKSCDSVEDVWIGAFKSYWGCFITLSISKFEKELRVFLIKKNKNDLLLMSFFVQKKSQTI
jgi:hypothetical protein